MLTIKERHWSLIQNRNSQMRSSQKRSDYSEKNEWETESERSQLWPSKRKIERIFAFEEFHDGCTRTKFSRTFSKLVLLHCFNEWREWQKKTHAVRDRKFMKEREREFEKEREFDREREREREREWELESEKERARKNEWEREREQSVDHFDSSCQFFFVKQRHPLFLESFFRCCRKCKKSRQLSFKLTAFLVFFKY